MKEIIVQCIADIGDKIYFIHNNRVKTGTISNISIWKSDCATTYSIAVNHFGQAFVFSGSKITTTIFTDKDKARQFLKENK